MAHDDTWTWDAAHTDDERTQRIEASIRAEAARLGDDGLCHTPEYWRALWARHAALVDAQLEEA